MVSVPCSNITLLTGTDGVMEVARSSVGSTGTVFSKLLASFGAAVPVRARREISRASHRITRLMRPAILVAAAILGAEVSIGTSVISEPLLLVAIGEVVAVQEFTRKIARQLIIGDRAPASLPPAGLPHPWVSVGGMFGSGMGNPAGTFRGPSTTVVSWKRILRTRGEQGLSTTPGGLRLPPQPPSPRPKWGGWSCR
jgi:hypothetical protein